MVQGQHIGCRCARVSGTSWDEMGGHFVTSWHSCAGWQHSEAVQSIMRWCAGEAGHEDDELTLQIQT